MLTRQEYDELVKIVQDVFAGAIRLFWNDLGDPKWEGKKNAYFCAASRATGRMYFPPSLIGEAMEDDPAKRIYVVQEKLGRLARHPEHSSSRQSRNPLALPWGEWGGAIALPIIPQLELEPMSLGMTGLPELGDEAVILVTAREFLRNLRMDKEQATGQSIYPASLDYLGSPPHYVHLCDIADYPDPEPNRYFYALRERRKFM